MRGICILCVVLAHVIEKNYSEADLIAGNGYNILYFSNTVVMIFISGYLAYNKTSFRWIVKYILRLGLPLCSFVFIVWASGTYLHLGNYNFTTRLGSFLYKEFFTGVNDLVLWFLWTLLMCHVILSIFEYVVKFKHINKIPMWLLLLGMIIIINVLPYNNFNFDTVKWFGSFYFIGYFIRYIIVKYSNNKLKLFRILKYSLFIASPIAIIAFGLSTNWMNDFGKPYVFYGYTNALYTITNAHNGWLIIGGLLLGFSLKTTFFYTISKGIVLIRIKYFNLIKRFLVYCGVASIGIYVIHTSFTGIVNNVVLSFLITISISIIIYEIVKRWKWSNFILFGNGELIEIITDKIINLGKNKEVTE